MVEIKGAIEGLTPTLHGRINEEAGILCLENIADGIRFVVDTGFTGGISIPNNMLDILNLDFVGFDMFRLASGEIIELPTYIGYIEVSGYKIKTWFIPGESLIGMEFLSATGNTLVLDFKTSTVRLTME